MKNGVKSIWIVLVLLLMLISCGQPAVAPSPAPAPVAAETEVEEEVSSTGSETEAAEEISFMIFGDTAEKDAYEQLVTAFEQRHSDIKVTLIHIPGQSDYRKRLGIDFAAGTPADIVLLNYRRYANFAAKGALEPLGPYLEKSDLIKPEDFYAESLAPFYWEGTLMCIPQNLS